jgi:hypothetical protein
LEREGIAITFKYSGSTDIRQGVIFGKDGFSFNGSKIDRQFSFSKLDAILNTNAQRREVRNVSPPTPPQSDHKHNSEPNYEHSQSHNHSNGNILSGLDITSGAGAEYNAPLKNLARKRREVYQFCKQS